MDDVRVVFSAPPYRESDTGNDLLQQSFEIAFWEELQHSECKYSQRQ